MFVVITGASKGIGMEITKQLLIDGENTVLAISRNATDVMLLRSITSGMIDRKNIITFGFPRAIEREPKKLDQWFNLSGVDSVPPVSIGAVQIFHAMKSK